MRLSVNGALAAAVALIVGVGTENLVNTRQLASSERWVSHSHAVREALTTLAADVAQCRIYRNSYVLTGETRYRSEFTATAGAADRQAMAVQHLTADNGRQRPRATALVRLVHGTLTAFETTLDHYQAHSDDRAVQAGMIASGERLTARVAAALAEMRGEEDRLLAARLAQRDRRTRAANATSAAGVALSLAILTAAALALRRETRDRATAETRVREKSTILAAILNSIVDGVVVADPSGRLTHVNPAAERLHGRPDEGVTTEQWTEHFEVFGEDGVTPCPTEQLPLVRALNGEHVSDAKLYLRHPDGSGVWLDISAAPVRTQEGTNLGGVVVLRDATERTQSEREIQRLNAELGAQVRAVEATNHELESFSYSVSHDLRSPLRTIDGFSQALLEDYADTLDAEASGHLKRIVAATQRMGRLIDDMLTLSRVTRRELACEHVDLSAAATSTVEELRRNDPQRQVRARVAEGIVAEGDPQLLRAVLDNLVGNAWKFTGKTAAASIEVGIEQETSGEPAVFVRDNGAGFDPAYAHKLFGAFQRLHAMEEYVGTGIGLATVQRVIHRHGGRVWATGQVGQGATFYFTLPGLRQEATNTDLGAAA